MLGVPEPGPAGAAAAAAAPGQEDEAPERRLQQAPAAAEAEPHRRGHLRQVRPGPALRGEAPRHAGRGVPTCSPRLACLPPFPLSGYLPPEGASLDTPPSKALAVLPAPPRPLKPPPPYWSPAPHGCPSAPTSTLAAPGLQFPRPITCAPQH